MDRVPVEQAERKEDPSRRDGFTSTRFVPWSSDGRAEDQGPSWCGFKEEKRGSGGGEA